MNSSALLTSPRLPLLLSLILGSAVALSACGEKTAPPDDEGGDAGAGGQNTAPRAMCEMLFGRPNQHSGLDENSCAPVCKSCQFSDSAGGAGGVGGATAPSDFEVPDYTAEDRANLRSFELLNPPAELSENPYLSAESYPLDEQSVCALLFESSTSYRLSTFASAAAAEAAGAQVTHHGACGACSSLEDLAVYIEIPDLTTPVRQCALDHIGQPAEDAIPCISGLGFTPACAEIWAYNSYNTRQVCLAQCVTALEDPYHLPDGSPNHCISCDEEKSGPIFKAVSGRTRRNSGLPTALCRPCDGVAALKHFYSAP